MNYGKLELDKNFNSRNNSLGNYNNKTSIGREHSQINDIIHSNNNSRNLDGKKEKEFLVRELITFF